MIFYSKRGTFMSQKQRKRKRKAAARQRKKTLRRQLLLFACDIVMAGILVCILLIFSRGITFKEIFAKTLSALPSQTAITPVEMIHGEKSTEKDSLPKQDIGNLSLDHERLLADGKAEEILFQLAQGNADIAEIYAHRTEYPEDLLIALAANQELTEYVKNFLTADASVNGGFDAGDKEQAFPLFLQWDSRWGYAPYGGSRIGISGCGPTCLSMVIYALTRNEEATPDALAAYSMNNGYYTEGVGTAWALMTDAPSSYGVKASELGLDEAAMKQYLDWGNLIICAMRPGDFTTTGHFIVIYGYDQNGFLVNDPNSRQRSEKSWDFDTLHYQIKNLWGYSKA